MPSAEPEHSTLLSGQRLRLVRGAWLAGVMLYATLFVLGAPAGFERARVLAPSTRDALQQLGIAPASTAVYWLTLDSLTFISFAAIALFIVWRRPDDWMVMLTSLMLLGTATLYTVPPAEAPLPIPLTALAFGLAEVFQVSFLYLFPNGRLLPRWIWLLLIPLLIWRPLIWGLVYLPDFYQTTRTGDNYGTLRQLAEDIALILVLFVGGIVSQVYRYRRISTLEQRQQTKWLVFGMISTFLVAGMYVLLVNVLGLLEGEGGIAILGRMLGRTFRQIALLMLPITLAFSILRYRLWDIDLLLRRTLVYVPLTAILAGMIAALITFSKTLTLELFGAKSLLVTIGITLVAVSVAEPLKEWLQKKVDARFKYSTDPRERMEAFAERVEKRLSRAQPRQLVERFCDQAISAFGAASGSAYLEQDGELVRVYACGEGTRERLTIPLLAGSRRLGAITLGERPFHREYARQDRITLSRAAGVVAAAIEQDAAEQ